MRASTAAIRSCASPFVTRKRTDSGNSTPSTGASTSGARPPPTSRTRQPKSGSTRAAMKPAIADPSVKPQNIRVTSDDRRAAGQNSDGQRDRHRHRPAETQSGQEAQDDQRRQAAAVRRRKAGGAEHDHRRHQHRLAAVAVGERADREGAEHQPEESGGEQRAELCDRQPPLRADRRRDEADDGGVEPIDGDDEEAEEQQPLLQPRHWLGVDERLDVDDARGVMSVLAAIVLDGVGHLAQETNQRLCLGRA